LGHTRLLLDGNGNVINRYAYDAWGNLIEYEEAVPNPFTWNGAYGYEYIPLTGLYHVGAREYDPRTGRWLQRDPIEASSGDPHFWRYCGNDPLNLKDPTGTEVNPYLDAGISLIPVVGGLWDIGRGLYEGDLLRAGLGAVSLLADAFTFGGGGSTIRGAASTARLARQAGQADVRLLTYITSRAASLGHNARGIFRGPTAKCFDWDHILKRHSARGIEAQDYVQGTKFPEGMTDDQIQATVKEAWKNRENYITRGNTTWYRGTDTVSGLIIEFIFNKITRTVDTAYPIDPTRRLRKR
jgi:RHS repeat-associated protein